VQKAFEQGVARLSAEGIAEVDTPELLVRAGVDAYRIVLVGRAMDDDGGVAAPYFSVQREAIEEHIRRFVGRVAVSEALDRFLARAPRGYFLIRGAPGQGKSAVACHLIKSRGWPHHLISRTGGRSDVRLVLRSLITQLAAGKGSAEPLPESVPELAKALEDRLARASARSGRLVVVLDGLDELIEESGQDLPFLVTEGLPPNVYFVVTSRPGDRLDRLLEALHSTTHELHDLGPLEPPEVATILRLQRPDLEDAKIELAAKASKGNGLFLRAVADELERNPDYDLRELPASVEGFFRRALSGLDGRRDPLLTDVLGLLATARKPLALRELAQITGATQREVRERSIGPIRQFLLELDEGFSFYHARFHEFVTDELLYEDELPRFHASLASWLRRSECRSSDYRYLALAYHLDRAGDRDGLWATVEPGFLREKIRRCGYAVLEDVVLLARDAIDTGDPSRVGRCIELVEALREIAGGDLVDEARLAIQGRGPAATASRNRIEAPEPPRIPGIDVYIGMLPKSTVGADFVEALRWGNGLMLALGDAPGVGLKGAFVARFVAGLVRRLAERAGALEMDALLEEVDRIMAPHPFFDPISLQCVAVDPSSGTLTIAGAGHPHPVFYSARRGQCDRLPVGDELLLARQRVDQPAARRRQRHAEIGPGDLLVMVSDGLTESHGMAASAYGYRFERLIPTLASRGARAAGEAILEDWLVHSEGANYVDDVTVVVLAMKQNSPSGPRPVE
jgi:serine phosphatase RsbU (regulator of sigma subunit)